MSKVSIVKNLIIRGMECFAIRLPISAVDFIRVYYVSRSSILLLRSDPWYGRLYGDIKSPKSRDSQNVGKREKGGGRRRRRRRGSFPGNLLVHDEARVLQPRRAVTDGKARYKNWVRARIRPAGMRFTYVPLIHVIFTSFPPRQTFTPCPSSSAIATLRRSVFARMRSVSRDPILQNLHIARSVNPIRYHDRSLAHNNSVLKQSSDSV